MQNDVKVNVTWYHLAIGQKDNVQYPVEEESTLVKEDGNWKYESATVRRPPFEKSNEMMVRFCT